MKKFFVLLFFSMLIPCVSMAQNSLPVGFDERTDLLSVVFRLAGNREYNQCGISTYSRQVDDYFSNYKQHQVVTFAQQCVQNSGISYDAVVAYAMHLVLPNKDNANIVFDTNFKKGGDDSFDRWSEEEKQEFLQSLNDFYQKSQFHQWYESTRDIREEAIASFNENIAKSIDLAWFNQFFGSIKNADFQVVLSLLVGPNNYGCSAALNNGVDKFAPVIGCAHTDTLGKIVYANKNVILPIVIHEFCHGFCNPLNAENWDGMKDKAESVFKLNAVKLSQMAYTNAETMMNETFVRSCVIRYILDHHSGANADQLIKNESDFYLTSTLVESLTRYESSREKYATMADYMPELVKDINAFDVKAFQKQQKQNQKLLGRVVKCSIKNRAKNVPAGKQTLVIQFSKPMMPGIALGYGASDGQFLDFEAALRNSFSWSNDRRTISIYLDLKPDTHYAFSILGDYFQTEDGHPLDKTTFIDFWTKK